MLLLQDVPAETTAYMIAGYAVIFGMMFIYLISLYVRQRNAIKELQMFQELDQTKKDQSGYKRTG